MVLKRPGWWCLLGPLLLFGPGVKGSFTSACPNATGQEGTLAMGHDDAVWFRPKAGTRRKDFILQFNSLYELQLKKRAGSVRVTLTELKGGQGNNIFDMARIPEVYFPEDSWASIRMSEEEVTLTLRKNDLEGMETRLWGLQMELVDEVATGADVLALTKCSPVIDPTTPTTTITTPSAITTPTTTTSPMSSSTEAWTGTAPPEDDTTPAEGGDDTTPAEGAEGGSSDDPVLLEAADGRCFGGAPLWAWICACLLGLLVLLLLVLAVYVVVLSGQNKRMRARLAKQGPASRSRLAPSPSAGLGVQTSEVEFYQVRNPSLMVAEGTLSSSHTAPRLPGGHHAVYTPASQASKGHGSSSTPRLSAFRRSMSQPVPIEAGRRDPPSFEFPAPPATPPPGRPADEAEDYVNAETLMIDDSQRRGRARDAEPFPRSVDSLLRELQFE